MTDSNKPTRKPLIDILILDGVDAFTAASNQRRQRTPEEIGLYTKFEREYSMQLWELDVKKIQVNTFDDYDQEDVAYVQERIRTIEGILAAIKKLKAKATAGKELDRSDLHIEALINSIQWGRDNSESIDRAIARVEAEEAQAE